MTLLRWDFSVPGPPMVGFSLASCRGGESVQVLERGFYTSDDGPPLYTFLDSFYGCVLRHGVSLEPERIDAVFVSIVEGTKVTAIVNPPLEMHVLTKESVEGGAPVYRDQLADIVEVRIPGYELPAKGAIAYIFQHGWRRGFYFDFCANSRNAPTEATLGDVPALLGSLHAALLLRDRIRMEPATVHKMATAGWFPFTRLSNAHALSLYRHFENDWEPTEPVAAILKELTPQIGSMVEAWSQKPAFAPHVEVLRTGARLFANGEYLAAASTVLPKIEGVLRHLYAGTNARPNAPELRKHLVGRIRATVEGYTALLPEAFVQYLETYYYASFNLSVGDVPASRHAFLHGVGPDEVLKDPSYCLRLFLTLDQVFFCLSRMKEVGA
jgi:hypothetical protein